MWVMPGYTTCISRLNLIGLLPPLQLCTCYLWLLFPEVLASYTSKTIVNLSVHRQTYRNKQSIHISSPLYTSVGGCCWSHGQKAYVKVVICFVGAASQSCHLEKLGLRKYIHITCPHYVWHQNHFKLYSMPVHSTMTPSALRASVTTLSWVI